MQKILLPILFVLLVAARPVGAQDLERYAPKTLPSKTKALSGQNTAAPTAPSDTRLLVKQLKGIVFVSKPSDIKSHGIRNVRGIQAEGLPLLQTPAFAKRMENFLGKAQSLATINNILRTVVVYYADHDQPFVNVVTPAQELTSGVLQVLVVEGRLGEVRVKGNKWFSTASYQNEIELHPGDMMSRSILDRDVLAINMNPFRTANAYLSPGSQPGTADVTIEAKDKFPLRVYTGYDNNGTRGTDENELFTGFNYGNLFGLGHQLGYQYTTSADFHSMDVHSASYFAPLPWHHTISIFGAYSETTPTLPNAFNLKGRATQISLRYNIPLRAPSISSHNFRQFSHEISVGYDYKSTNSNLAFGGLQVFNQTVEVSQFVIGYNARLDDRWGRTDFGVTGFLSPGGMTGNNETSDFVQQRAGADSNYAYVRLDLSRTTRLPHDFSLVNKFTGQFASGPLISSEQLGVGGYDSVRGYAERIRNGDQGFLMTHEVRTPSMHPLQSLSHGKANDDLQLLAFFDYGIAELESGGGVGSNWEHLASIGVGVRYAITPYFLVQADYGIRLLSLTDEHTGSRINASATLSY